MCVFFLKIISVSRQDITARATENQVQYNETEEE